MKSTGDPETDALLAKYYRWWTVRVWLEKDNGAVKLGPVTICWYRWFDERLRVSFTTAYSSDEHIIFGGPLATEPQIVDTDAHS